MLAFLTKCFVILLGLWIARYFHLIPWSDLMNIGTGILAPLFIAALAWRSGRLATLRKIVSGVQDRAAASEAQDRL